MATSKQSPAAPTAPHLVVSSQPLAPESSGSITVAGFIFDPSNFPFTLLETLTTIAKEIRELGLEKTGGKKSDDPEVRSKAKYAYFEEAEIAAHLTVLLAKHEIGYAAGTPKITGRFENGKTNAGGSMWNHQVSSSVIFSHRKSREWIIIPGVGEAADAGDKGVTKAITSAIKYIWMKTFLISEGNDIELDQGGDHGEQEQSKTRTTKTKRTVVNKCGDCKGDIVDFEKNGEVMPAEVIATKTKYVFGTMLCRECGLKRKNAQKTPAQQKQQSTAARIDEKGRKLEHHDTTLVSWKKRNINVKGKKKTVVDLVLFGGVNITDWHESHFDHYQHARAKAPIELICSVSEKGEYVNRDVYALIHVDGELIEDEYGNKIEPSPAEQSDNNYDHQDEAAFANDENPF